MKKILYNIRSKSPEFKLGLSLLLSLVLTTAIVVGYVLIKSAEPADTSDAPSPFSALGQSIKSAASKSSIANSDSNVQIIDASQNNNMSDQNQDLQGSAQ